MLKLVLRISIFLTVTLVVAELFFRYVIPAASRALSTQEPMYGIMIFDSTKMPDGQNTIGPFGYPRIRWHVNNYGWLSFTDYEESSSTRKPVIAVIGDSYIEGYQVNKGEHLSAVLQKLLGDRYNVYSFGASGTALSDYLNISRYAKQHFDPDLYIVVIQERDLHDSVVNYGRLRRNFQIQYGENGFAEVPVEERYYPNRVKRFLRNSSFLCYLTLNRRYQFFEDFGRHRIQAAFRPGYKRVIKSDDRGLNSAAAGDLVKRFHDDHPGKSVIYVIDGDRKDIEFTQQARRLSEADLLSEACIDSQEFVVDMASVFTQRYRKEHTPFNFRGDYHWNSYGHRVVAETLNDFLQKHQLVP